MQISRRIFHCRYETTSRNRCSTFHLQRRSRNSCHQYADDDLWTAVAVHITWASFIHSFIHYRQHSVNTNKIAQSNMETGCIATNASHTTANRSFNGSRTFAQLHSSPHSGYDGVPHSHPQNYPLPKSTTCFIPRPI